MGSKKFIYLDGSGGTLMIRKRKTQLQTLSENP